MGYLNEIHKIPMLTREQEFDVATKAREGDQEARDLLVRSNLRFVVTVARRYQSYGLSLMDLINEGNLGLIKAAERFNPNRDREKKKRKEVKTIEKRRERK